MRYGWEVSPLEPSTTEQNLRLKSSSPLYDYRATPSISHRTYIGFFDGKKGLIAESLWRARSGIALRKEVIEGRGGYRLPKHLLAITLFSGAKKWI